MPAALQGAGLLRLPLRRGLAIARKAVVQRPGRSLGLHLRQQRGQRGLRIAHDAYIYRPVETNGRGIGVYLDERRAFDGAPQRRLSPRIQLAQARAHDEHDIGFAARRGQGILVEDVDVLRVIFGDNAARGQGGGHHRAQVLAQGDERGRRT